MIRTLIVEDDFTSRVLLQSFLSQFGDCHIAVNGKEAVAAVRAAREDGRPYELICMDIMMPEMDGHSAVREIRALEQAQSTLPTQAARIIMITALNDANNVLASLHALCDGYLLKPIQKRVLLSRLQELRLL